MRTCGALAALLLVSALPFTLSVARAARVISTAEKAQASAFCQQAFAAYQAGDYTQAHSLIDQAEKLRPDQPDALNLRGAVYLKQAAYDKAEVAFSRAVALDPDLWAAQCNRAEVPFRQKDYTKARHRFETLLEQTDRFKDAGHWEFAAYKIFLCSLLAGDDAGARQRLAKLPAKGAATPASLYASAALAFSHKDQASAERSLSAAQAAFKPAITSVFADSLENSGWLSALAPAPAPVYVSSTLPAGVTARLEPRRTSASVFIDPRLESAAAEPLPSPDEAAAPMPVSARASMPPKAAARVAPKPTFSLPPLPAATPDQAGLGHGGLLLN